VRDTGEVGVADTGDTGEKRMELNDTGVIERPRDIAVSTSHQQLQRSLRGASEAGSQQRSMRGASEAGSRQSSSLNRERRTSPDHIPRLHECWSLEPVRRAHQDRTAPQSELSSLESLPVSSRPPPSELPNSKSPVTCSSVVCCGVTSRRNCIRICFSTI